MHTYWTSMLRSIDSCQNRVSAHQYHLTVSRAQASTHRGRVFLEVIRWQVTSFQMIAGSRLFFKIDVKYIVFMCRTIKILISNWPRTRKFSQLLHAGKTVAFDFAHNGHALVTLDAHVYLWLVKIWQVSLCAKFMQHLDSCLLFWLWQLKLTEFFFVNLWCF